MCLHQTHDTTWTIELLKKILGTDSFTKFRDELLQGTADLEGLGLTSLQKYTSKKLKKYQEHYNNLSRHSYLLKTWQADFKIGEKHTTIFSSGRHLDHYKALFTFDEENDKELKGFTSEIFTVYNTIINTAITLYLGWEVTIKCSWSTKVSDHKTSRSNHNVHISDHKFIFSYGFLKVTII